MGRYFFDIHENDDFMFDDVGVELPDVEAAHREGLRSLMAIASEKPMDFASERHLTMDVRNENGVVFSLSAALRSTLP